MEPKKNPKFDIHRKSGIIFNFSLTISLLLVITAFKWSVETPMKKEFIHDNKITSIEMLVPPVVYEKKKELPTSQVTKTPELKPLLEAINFKSVNDSKPVEEPPTDVFDQNDSPMTEFPIESGEIPREKLDTVFIVVEKMPEPDGGWKTFFKTLQDNMKYPRNAARSDVAGKVYVSFTVNEKGGLQDFSIVKGIGYGCDEEAQRVIALTKWSPGKQRGRPVKVRLVQPVIFSLGTP